MSMMSSVDIDLQELLATVATVGSDYDLFNPDSDDALDGRAILFSRLCDLGWISPTEANSPFAKQAAGLL